MTDSPPSGQGNNNIEMPTDPKQVIGWREWIDLSAIGLPAIKAKVDTGARTSALHAFYVTPFEEAGQDKVRFGIHPLQQRTDIEVVCVADVVDQRLVSDSGGHREMRYVIEAPIRLGELVFPIEITLTDRDTMAFRMLLGRTAIRDRFLIDPTKSYLFGRLRASIYKKRLKKPRKTERIAP